MPCFFFIYLAFQLLLVALQREVGSFAVLGFDRKEGRDVGEPTKLVCIARVISISLCPADTHLPPCRGAIQNNRNFGVILFWRSLNLFSNAFIVHATFVSLWAYKEQVGGMKRGGKV